MYANRLACIFFCAISVLLALSSNIFSDEKGKPNNSDKLKHDFQAAMDQLDSSIDNLSLRAKISFTFKRSPPKKDLTRDGMEFAVLDGFKFCLRKTPGGVIYGVNPEYAFAITTAGTNDQYVVQMVSKVGSSPSTERLIKEEIRRAKSFLLNACRVHDKSLPELDSGNGGGIISILPVDKQGKNYARIELGDFHNETGELLFSDNYIICDPALQWAIIEWGYKNHSLNAVLRGKQDCLLVEDSGIPVATKFQHGAIGKDGKNSTASHGSLEILNNIPVTKEEFYLSYYGLPEPKFENLVETTVKDALHEGKLPTWFWYLLAGLCCLAVAYWIKRRRASV